METKAHCARCKIPRSKRVCLLKEGGKGPTFCPTLNYKDLIIEVTKAYQATDLKNFARLASVQEAECYANRKPGPYVRQPIKCRVQETIEFAQKLGFKKLGIAFCGGLHKEAGLLADALESNGFELASVGCNAGGVPKEAIGIKEKKR